MLIFQFLKIAKQCIAQLFYQKYLALEIPTDNIVENFNFSPRF